MSHATNRPSRRRVFGVSTVTAFSTVVAGLAVTHEGAPAAELDLHDGGVWVTNSAENLVAHLNFEAGVLTSGLRTLASDVDLAQHGSTVIVTDPAAGAASQVDLAQAIFTNEREVTPGSQVHLGGSTVAVIDEGGQALWVDGSGGLGSLDLTMEPDISLPVPAVITVGTDGTVHAALAEIGEMWSIGVGTDGNVQEPAVEDLGDLGSESDLEITAVGGEAVVLDRATDTLYLPDGTVSMPEGARLQQPGTAADSVLVASEDALIFQPLDASEARRAEPREVGGAPAAPVFLNGCGYGAWSQTAQYLRYCGDPALDVTGPIPGDVGAGELVFRVNRDVVVLNNPMTGGVWLTDDDLSVVDNWLDVTPPDDEGDDEDEDGDQSMGHVSDLQMPERTEDNTPPVANDDEYGVRPGATTILPVLTNDTDPDLDVLTASLESEPTFGQVQTIQRGNAFQIVLDEEASGSASFEYRVDDGRGGEAVATVRLQVRDWATNAAPEQERVPSVVVEQGSTVEYRVLDDWIDPDGDEVFLVSATTSTGDEVHFTPDGRVTFKDVGTTNGRKTVEVVVSDGQEVTDGTMTVDVRAAGQLPPVANQDHVQTQQGVEVSVAPLGNDTDPNEDELRLAAVSEVADAQIRSVFDAGTFTFQSDRVGTHYVVYEVTDGEHSVPGLVRVDVLEPQDEALPPVAVRDVAMVQHGGEALVDVLSNDQDPTGGVLVTQSIEVPDDSGLRVAVIDHRYLRIISTGVAEGPTSLTYTVTNGAGQSTGNVIVLPVPRPTVLPPPVAADDEVVVRAGDVVDIRVLDNDFHPNGDTMTVDPELVQGPEDGQGLAFVAGNLVRFQAAGEAGTVHLIYQVKDSTGQSDSAQVTIRVREQDAESNAAPRPPTIEARVFAGGTVRIPVALTGVDPDGDSVTLLGIDQPPTLGTVTATGRDWIEYTAADDASGTDDFVYAVQDRYGARGTARVQVGVTAPGPNQAPIALDDVVTVQPDRVLWVQAMSNDLDPDGDDLRLVENSLEVVAGDIEPEVVGNRIEIQAPAEETTAVLYYTVADPDGTVATASVTLNVSETAELARPIARDDAVSLADVGDPGADGRVMVTVPVLDNDEDPDGRTPDLAVTVQHPDAQVDETGSITIPVADERQIVPYAVTDVDDQVGMAFVWLPGLVDDRRPVLRDVPPPEVESGTELLIDLEDYVSVAPGRTPRLTRADSVSAVHSDGTPPMVDATTLTFTSASGYHGPASVTFEVTDGTGPDDPEGRTAVLTIPIVVLPGEQEEEPPEEETAEEEIPTGAQPEATTEPEPVNAPPQVRSTTVQVAPGESPTILDLRTVVSDPDPGDMERMSYGLASQAPGGFTARLDGSVLSVGAAASTGASATATLTVTADDGTNEPVSGTVRVVVVSSTRPLAVVNDDVVPAAHQGETVRVAVLSNDVSPFPGEPLRLVGAPQVEAGDGNASLDGSHVVITPAPSFVGTMVVRYRVGDVTGDPGREVDGRVRVTVQGRPDAPATPTVTEVRSQTVVLSWSPPASNGAEISHYTVTADGFSQRCETTTCTLGGLTNNVEYTFRVSATNAVGESEPSPPSAPARPDGRPSPPSAPSVAFGNRSLSVSWQAPTGYDGSPVDSYNLRISPAPDGGPALRTGVTGTSLVWDGLANGTAYRVEVQAVNRAPEPSDWSAPSASEIPAGVPATPAAPATSMLEPVGAQAQMQVSWSAPASNGAEISQYVVTVIRGSAQERVIEVAGGSTQQAVVLPTSESNYTFTVAARNKAGLSTASAPSAPRRAVTPPGAPGSVSAAPADRAVSVTYAAAPGNGARAEEISYQYSLNGGNWAGFGAGPGTRTISGLTNGTTYAVRVRAVTTVDGQTYAGPAVTAPQTPVPYGAPGTPSVSASASGTNVTFSWSPPAPNGRPITVQRRERVGSGSWTSWVNAGSGPRTVSTGYSTVVRMQVRAVDTEDQVSSVDEAQATTVAPPAPEAWVTRGGSAGEYCAGCTFMVVNYRNFSGGSRQVTCHWSDGATMGPYSFPFSGNGSHQTLCFTGTGINFRFHISGFGYSSWLNSSSTPSVSERAL